MIKQLYRKVNQYRKEAYLKAVLYKTEKKYAFVGFGMHSLTSLYPVLIHFGIDLKYICTRESVVPENIQRKFSGTVFINELDVMLKDPEIEGVFVSAKPEAHAGILTALLGAGKKVFIEKPPCTDSFELEGLIQRAGDGVVQIGLQRRYWPGNRYLSKSRGKARSYIYQFGFGTYPQGDVFNELFIHAIDYCIFLFGEFTILSSTHQKSAGGITTHMHVSHLNGISGMIELSTHYSWNDPVDFLSIHYADELLEVRYPTGIEGRLTPKRVFNIPAERLLKSPVISKKYFSDGNLVMPAFELNTLVLQGFYDEILSFVRKVEAGKHAGHDNDLTGVRFLYKVLDELRKEAYPTA
jgi:virulence factor